MRRFDFDVVQAQMGSFNRYQIALFFVTQLAYVAVTGSMLCTMFDTVIPKVDCFSANGSSITIDVCSCNSSFTLKPEFYSILTHLDLLCAHNYVPTLLTTAVMVGGVLGAIIFGHMADRYGRKPMCILSLVGVVFANVFLISIPSYAYLWIVVIVLYVLLGMFGGGYMVVNLVILLEAVGPNWRLFCTSVNGWPFGLITMALFGYLTQDWRYYHAVLAACGIPSVVGLLLVFESPRWLLQHGRYDEAQSIVERIAKINRKKPPKLDQTQRLVTDHEETKFSTVYDKRTYSYADLVRYRGILRSLLALSYSWFASSVVSFGIYFNLSAALPGDRYLNTFFTGLFKGAAGVLPLICGLKFGRKPVLLAACLVSVLCCWAAAVSNLVLPAAGIHLTVFAVIGASAIDPVWKVNHLYSTELFPTVVRNMARAVCNVGSRVGSVLGPQVSFLSYYYFPAPYFVFAVLSTVQLVVCALWLPETKNRPLPDAMPDVAEPGDGIEKPVSSDLCLT